MGTEDMFTKQEAVSFLQTEWEVERVEERFYYDRFRKGLLEEIVTLVHAKVPFQNITLMATDPEHRRRPSLITIKNECMSGVGGLGYNINVFVWGLLRALGFSAKLCVARMTITPNSANPHIIVLVYDLDKKGDVHLVDCGCMFPTLRVISLDFEAESPVFVDSFLQYRFIRYGGQILRMHGDGDFIVRKEPVIKDIDFIMEKWRLLYSFLLSPSDTLSEFDDLFEVAFTDPSASRFHNIIMALNFPAKGTVMLATDVTPTGQSVCCLTIENGESMIYSMYPKTDKDVIDICRRYFPTLEEDAVRKALQHWYSLEK